MKRACALLLLFIASAWLLPSRICGREAGAWFRGAPADVEPLERAMA